MYVLLYSLLQYVGLGYEQPAKEAPKYKSITIYNEHVKYPGKSSTYVNTYKAKNYGFYFNQTINRNKE